jgi:hypothetical protein
MIYYIYPRTTRYTDYKQPLFFTTAGVLILSTTITPASHAGALLQSVVATEAITSDSNRRQIADSV